MIVRTIDDALSAAERAALRRHLASCQRCHAEYETQHDVRRLLVLQMPDPLPEGFDERLNARLARLIGPEFAGGHGVAAADRTPSGSPVLVAAPRWPELAEAWQRDMRGRMWALRLIPLAATLALIVAGASVRDVQSRPDVSFDAQAATDPGAAPSAGAAPVGAPAPGLPRAFTTIDLARPNRGTRRERLSQPGVEAGGVAPGWAQAAGPAESAANDDAHVTEAVGQAVAAREHASNATKVAEGAVHLASRASDRSSASEPRGHESSRIAGRERSTSAQRASGEPVDEERIRGQRAASQQPGILPHPAAPIPHARQAMPAPSAVMPDRTIPPP